MKSSKQSRGVVGGGGKIVFAILLLTCSLSIAQGQPSKKLNSIPSKSKSPKTMAFDPPVFDAQGCTEVMSSEINGKWLFSSATNQQGRVIKKYWLGRNFNPNGLIGSDPIPPVENNYVGINTAEPTSVLDVHIPENLNANPLYGLTVSTGSQCSKVGLVAGDHSPSWVGSYNYGENGSFPFQVRAGNYGTFWNPSLGTYIHLNPSNERIGINTATPAATLDVNGDAKADNLKLTQVPAGLVGINGSGMISPATSGQVGQLMFANLSADFIPKMGANAALENSSLINTSFGRIGFGIANPLARFHFKHPTSNFSPDFLGNRENEMMRFSNQWNGNNTDLGITFDNGVTPQEIHVAWKVTAGVAGGNRFRIRNIITTPNPNEEPIIEDKTLISMNGANGNVGIGTEPVGTHRLLVNGKIKADGLDLTNGNQVVHLASGTENRIPKFSSNAGELQNSTITETEGNVGIGTLSPATKMEIKATGNDAALLTLNAEAHAAKGIQITDNGTTKWKIAKEANSEDLVIGDGSLGNSIRLKKQSSGSPARFIIGSQDVSNSSGFINIKLACDGTGIFKELGVLPGANWSDYVFDKDYCLMPLDSVSSFIKTHHHLPEIPSAKEVAEKGIKLAEMNALLLKKIEELTLHLIDLKSEVDKLKGQK